MRHYGKVALAHLKEDAAGAAVKAEPGAEGDVKKQTEPGARAEGDGGVKKEEPPGAGVAEGDAKKEEEEKEEEDPSTLLAWFGFEPDGRVQIGVPPADETGASRASPYAAAVAAAGVIPADSGGGGPMHAIQPEAFVAVVDKILAAAESCGLGR